MNEDILCISKHAEFMPLRRKLMASTVLGALLPTISPPVRATVLTRQARILLGFAPGAAADLIARALAQRLSGYAPSLILDYKPGAGGRIALEALKSADPDGSTLVVTPSAMVVLYPYIYKKLSYEPLKDFVPVAELCSFPFLLVVGPMVPPDVTTVAQFVAWCKAYPRQAAYASSGSGTIPHFLGVGLAHAAQVALTHVPYKGGALAMNDVLGGQIAACIAVISNALPLLTSGKLRALAVTGERRSAALPEVPTLIEAGYRDVHGSESFGVFLPSRASNEIVLGLNALIQAALLTPAMKDVLAKASFDISTDATPAQYAQSIRLKFAQWGELVKASGFAPED